MISFAIPGTPGAVRTITLASPLPIITNTTFIDGTTQAAFDGQSPSTPLVELDGGSIPGPSSGLIFGQGAIASGLFGISVFGFGLSQVELDSPSDVVQGNYLGYPANPKNQAVALHHAAFRVANPASNGLVIQGDAAVIGGMLPSERNVISNNLGAGILFEGSGADGHVLGNSVGTDPSGTLAVPNLINGIELIGPAFDETIGPGNVISGNGGIGVEMFGTSGNRVVGNSIGVDASGTLALGNGSSGLCVDGGSSLNMIGGTGPADANVISGNGVAGVAIQGGSSQNQLIANRIGTDAAGGSAIPNLFDGVAIVGAPANLVGPGNVISGNAGLGVEIFGSSGNRVVGNSIGVDASGTLALGNGSSGLCVDGGSSLNMIGGTGPADANVISGNGVAGVAIQGGSSQNQLIANRIGTDAAGGSAIPNGANGVMIVGAPSNVVGPGNLISGNGGIGVEIVMATGNMVVGDRIGTDSTGGKSLGNRATGICVDLNSTLNTIGGTTPAQSNVISGNGVAGVAIQGGSSRNQVAGNEIGTDSAGSKAIGNGIAGILISQSPSNLIGPGNLISGNGTVMPGAGIWIDLAGSTGNTVAGNSVGTDRSGQHALGNASIGILVNEASGNLIGPDGVNAGNLISGNSQIGVMLAGAGATRNFVQGNLVGTNMAGTGRIGNGNGSDGIGVYLENAPGNTIGGPMPGQSNVISGNGFDGLVAFGPGAAGNLIQGNKIGSDLAGSRGLGNGDDGVVLNDAAGNTVSNNVITSNALDGITLSGPGTTGNSLVGNSIGVGIGGQPLGNGTFGILITNQAQAAGIGANLIANNGLGPIRNTNIVAANSTTTAPNVSKGSEHANAVKVGHPKPGTMPHHQGRAKAKAKVHGQGVRSHS